MFQMGSLDNQAWELFLRKVISRTLGVFGRGREGGKEEDKLEQWNAAQVRRDIINRQASPQTASMTW